MKFIIVFAALLAVALAAPRPQEDIDDSYSYTITSGNKAEGDAQGGYSYVGEDGLIHSATNPPVENDYQILGDQLPVGHTD